MRERAFHPWVTCADGPLAGAVLTVEWHWAVPPRGIWLTVDDGGGVVGLGPDKTLLNAVAVRHGSGGLGWLPYRCAEPEPLRVTGPDGAAVEAWVYRLDTAAATVRPHRR
jgi:hypothetical protein